MTRKDYEAIASILRNNREALEGLKADLNADTKWANALLASIEGDLMDLFESENPRFDRARFQSASRATRARREAVISQLEEAK